MRPRLQTMNHVGNNYAGLDLKKYVLITKKKEKTYLRHRVYFQLG